LLLIFGLLLLCMSVRDQPIADKANAAISEMPVSNKLRHFSAALHDLPSTVSS
jgi:hypothetical protein